MQSSSHKHITVFGTLIFVEITKIKWKFRHFTLNLMFIPALMLEAQMMLSITLSIYVSQLLVYEAVGKVT